MNVHITSDCDVNDGKIHIYDNYECVKNFKHESNMNLI